MRQNYVNVSVREVRRRNFKELTGTIVAKVSFRKKKLIYLDQRYSRYLGNVPISIWKQEVVKAQKKPFWILDKANF